MAEEIAEKKSAEEEKGEGVEVQHAAEEEKNKGVQVQYAAEERKGKPVQFQDVAHLGSEPTEEEVTEMFTRKS
ncbi:hypothetical protein BT96DRAFT_1000662 [Gymnopus androsaceus JB14]|uniref:Uncharacterized protein n=1 Tax=Gymnopus androsaceus JB14 TaxID=1447944 RepID=A0A6A4H2X1_9AGAR|nr:hypothetical protein BT96DRAFT_1000662 [Gymnopus androsaceus JB14]